MTFAASAPAARDSFVSMGFGAGGGWKGWCPTRMPLKFKPVSSGQESKCWTCASVFLFAFSSHCPCSVPILIAATFPVTASSFDTAPAMTEIISEGLFDLALCVKMLAKASSVTALGKLFVREMGR